MYLRIGILHFTIKKLRKIGYKLYTSKRENREHSGHHRFEKKKN